MTFEHFMVVSPLLRGMDWGTRSHMGARSHISIGSPVPDVIAEDLDVLFVGINPDPISAECGHHFANPRNVFWRLLHEAGFTAEQLDPSEEERLLALRIGVTNIVPRVARSSSELTRGDFSRGSCALREKIARWRPHSVVFVGLTGWRAVSKSAETRRPKLDGARVFVLPNPSGRNARYSYRDMLRRWRRVAHSTHERPR
jgi:TDG/mug DNA glycosylase family protein